MDVQRRNDTEIYCLSSGPTIPEWLGERARRNLGKRDESIRRRIELIQDFQMPSSSSKIVQSADGRYLIASGTYPPRIRCYDVHDLTMKFERYLNAHVVDMVLLSDTYGKIAILLDDRTIAFQAPYGDHESIRIPTFGRAMAYEPTTCELLIAAKGNNVYRLNLEEGRFNEPWTFDPAKASATCITVSPTYPLAAVGCDDGHVRLWDSRNPDNTRPFLTLDVQSVTAGYGFADAEYGNPNEITSVAHDPSGLYLAVGMAGGLVALYDVRSSRPIYIMEHKHGVPIHTIKFHPGSGTILTSDEKLVKIWRYKSSGDVVRTRGARDDETIEKGCESVGSVVANVEGTGKFSNFVMAGDESDPFGNKSGLLLCATDQPKMESYYIPSIGLAPKWCSFLENITEELEERDLTCDGTAKDGKESIFENYTFVSRDEVEKLGISNLVGTPLLRGYMHGFFMDISLYNRVRAVANPFAYEEYRKKKLKERIERKQASRIAPKESVKTSKHAVNPELATRLMDKSGDRTKAGKAAGDILCDDRFGSLFTNPDYEIDEGDETFKLRNPSGVATSKKRRNDMDSDDDDESEDEGAEHNATTPRHIGFSAVEAENEQSEGDDASDSDEDGFRRGKVRGELYDEMKELERPKKKKAHKSKKDSKKRKKKPVMYEADEANRSAVDIALGISPASDAFKRRKEEMSMSLKERLEFESTTGTVAGSTITATKGISKEVRFIPRDVLKKQQAERSSEESQSRKTDRSRRDIKDLRFKTPFKNSK